MITINHALELGYCMLRNRRFGRLWNLRRFLVSSHSTNNKVKIFYKYKRINDDFEVREDISRLIPPNATCLELGVAEGGFSLALLKRTPNIKHLYSVDMLLKATNDNYQSCIRAWLLYVTHILLTVHITILGFSENPLVCFKKHPRIVISKLD